MKVIIAAHKVNEPMNWETRTKFYFDYVEKVEISDYNEFANYSEIIYSKSYPLIRYIRGVVVEYKRATEEDLKEYCLMGEGKFCFPQTQWQYREIGKGICTK